MIDPAAKIDAILEWADEHSDFNTDFVVSLEDQLEAKSKLSESQERALDNILDAFRIGT